MKLFLSWICASLLLTIADGKRIGGLGRSSKFITKTTILYSFWRKQFHIFTQPFEYKFKISPRPPLQTVQLNVLRLGSSGELRAGMLTDCKKSILKIALMLTDSKKSIVFKLGQIRPNILCWRELQKIRYI